MFLGKTFCVKSIKLKYFIIKFNLIELVSNKTFVQSGSLLGVMKQGRGESDRGM